MSKSKIRHFPLHTLFRALIKGSVIRIFLKVGYLSKHYILILYKKTVSVCVCILELKLAWISLE